MEEERRQAIERRYVYNIEKPFPKELDYEKLDSYKQYEYNIVSNSRKCRQYGKEEDKLAEYVIGYSAINSYLSEDVSNCEFELKGARIAANTAFKEYMACKNDIKAGKFLYSDEKTRTTYQLFKHKWIYCSNYVLQCKSCLRQAELRYSRFLEWYDATNKHIKSLESQISQYKEGKGEIKTGVKLW